MFRGRRQLFVEAAIAVAALALIAVLVYGSYVAEGGLITDPWMPIAWYEFSPDKNIFSLSEQFMHRSGVGVVRSLGFIRLAVQATVFGSDVTLWLAWQVAMCVILSASLFLLLRMLGLGGVPAAVVAALVLIFPATSSMRLWAIMGSPAAITLAIFGFVTALRAFEAERERRLVLHLVSLGFFVCSAFIYESVIFVMAGSCLIYRLRVPWRQATRRWIVDVVVMAVIALVLQDKGSARGQQGFAGMLGHAGQMADQALTLFTTVVLPFGGVNRWLVLVAVALIPIVALVLSRRTLPTREAASLELWLWVLAFGLFVVAAGYAAYVPAADYYEPLSPGVGNRVNSVSSIGYALIVAALAMLAGILAFRSVSRAMLASGVGLALCVVVGVSWLQPLERDEDAFILANAEGDRVIHAVQTALPDPPPRTMIWALGHPFEVAPGVPVFDQFGNLPNRVRLAYGDPRFNSALAPPGTQFVCSQQGIAPRGAFYEDAVLAGKNESNYGKTYFVDTSGNQQRVMLIRNPRDCRIASAAFPRSPYLLGESVGPISDLPSSPGLYRLGPGGSALVSQGLRIPIGSGAVAGYVDAVTIGDGLITVSGWAAAEDLSGPAELVVALVDGKGVAEAAPDGERPDLVEVYGEPTLEMSGFVLSMEKSALACTARAGGLMVIGIVDNAATPLLFVGNSRQELNRACESSG